jgi:hypothetical protein
VLSLALPAAAPPEATPERTIPLRTDPGRLVLAPVEREDLLAERGEPGRTRQHSRVSVDVEPPEPGRGWELTLRTDPAARSVSAEKSPRVYWKLSAESASEFRRLGEHGQVVVRSPDSRSAKVTVDLAFCIDWEVAPGRHEVDFLFSIEPL